MNLQALRDTFRRNREPFKPLVRMVFICACGHDFKVMARSKKKWSAGKIRRNCPRCNPFIAVVCE